MLTTTTDLMTAVRAYINTILKMDSDCLAQYKDFLSQKDARQDLLKNDRGVSDMEEMKFTISMPDILGTYVFKHFPEILETKKNMYLFMKEFPQFCMPVDPNKTKYI